MFSGAFQRHQEFRLRLHERLAYSVGHFYNDLCASMWFTYLIVFFHYVLGFDNVIVGYLILLGQIIDAVCTPIIGFESDRTAGLCGYGKRKSWHLVGTIFISLTFPFLFMPCIGCEDGTRQWYQFVYYAPFVVAFQFGWASVQIAHLSIINQLTSNESERVELYGLRNANTLLANIMVYGVAWGLLGSQENQNWNIGDCHPFMILMTIVVSVGLVFSFLFHIGVKEACDTDRGPTDNTTEALVNGGSLLQNNTMTWKDWLTEKQFYLTGITYMLARLLFNVMQTYWPMLLTEMLKLDKKYSAIIPMVICVAGFMASLGMRIVNQILGRKLTFGLGILISSASIVWIWFLQQGSLEVFGPAIIIGVGSNTLLVTSLSMTADIIGNNVRSSAFVYGVMSFTDKISSGVALMLIQLYRPNCDVALSTCHLERAIFSRYVMVLLPSGCLVGCVIMLLIIAPLKLGALQQYSRMAVISGNSVNDEDRDAEERLTVRASSVNVDDHNPVRSYGSAGHTAVTNSDRPHVVA